MGKWTHQEFVDHFISDSHWNAPANRVFQDVARKMNDLGICAASTVDVAMVLFNSLHREFDKMESVYWKHTNS